MTDGSGNVHDLVVNTLDVTDGRGLYTDTRGNTFGGLYSPKQRASLSNAFRNTTIGSGSLLDLSTGDDNSIFGIVIIPSYNNPLEFVLLTLS